MQKNILSLNLPSLNRIRGFSVIELMVAIVIGMVAAIVIMQMFSLSEGRKRATTSGADSQTTAAVALYLVERDLRQAGYGIAPNPEEFVDVSANRFKAPPTGTFQDGILANCANVDAYNSARVGAANFTYSNSTFAPVVINPTGFAAGDAGSDVILINYGGSDGILGNGTYITLNATSTQVGGGGEDFVAMYSKAGFHAGDIVLAVPSLTDKGKDCLMGEVTGFGTGGADSNNIWHNQVSSYQSFYKTTPSSSIWNKNRTGDSWLTYGRLYNLGRVGSFVSRVYAVRNGNLTMCDLTKADCTKATSDYWTTIASGVVAMQVQYGKDTDLNGTIDVWDKTKLSDVQQAQVVAARIAIVARSSQYEKAADFVATTPVWRADATGTGNTNIDVSALVSNWSHYRYNVAQSLIPLRNMMWGEQK